jgi:hypothetical protein
VTFGSLFAGIGGGMSVLTFDPTAHEYSIDEQRVPSVTEVLSRTGLTNFDHIPEPYRRAALNRGRRVHKAAHYLAEGSLDWSTVSEDDKPYIESCAGFLAAGKVRFDFLERQLFHVARRYAGTCDGGGWWDGQFALVDWCCGDLWESAKDLQTAGYAEALRVTPPPEWPDFAPSEAALRRGVGIVRLGVRLLKSGAIAQPEPYRDPQDFDRFAAALAVTWEQERRGVKRKKVA